MFMLRSLYVCDISFQHLYPVPHQIHTGYMYNDDPLRQTRATHTHSWSLERGLLDGPRLVGLGLLELGEPVRHLVCMQVRGGPS